MPKWGDLEFSQLTALRERLHDALNGGNADFFEDIAHRIADALLRSLREKTPVGDDDGLDPEWLAARGFKGNHGILRRRWKVDVSRKGNDFVIRIHNNVLYAAYVEYGHRQTPGRYVPALGKSLKASFVPGQFIMKTSVDEVMKGVAPRIIKQYLAKHIEEILGGK